MLYCPSGNTIHTFKKVTTGQENTMGQYRLWLHHRTIDQNLREQQITHKQELSEIDEHIANLEEKAIPTNNPLLIMLMQQSKLQEYTNSKIPDITASQLEHNGARQESANKQKYQTPPPSNYGQQDNDLQTVDPRLTAQPSHISSGLLAWEHLANFSTQDIHLSAAQSADSTPILPAAADHHLPSDLHTCMEQKPQINEQLPWWLRDLMLSPPPEQEPPLPGPIDQYSIQTNQRVGLWFARRTRLVHYDK